MDVISYTVSEEAIPLDPTNMSGGYGTLDYTKLEEPGDSRRLYTNGSISDPIKGEYSGEIQRIEITDGTTSFTVNSGLAQFNRWVRAEPYEGELGDYFLYLADVCGVTSQIYFGANVPNPDVLIPGFNGNAWDYLRKIASLYSVKVSQIKSAIVFNSFTESTAWNNWETTRNVSLSTESTAERVVVNWYDSDWKDNSEIIIPEFDDAISVDAGERLEQEFEVNGSIEYLQETPQVFDYVGPNEDWTNTTGGYCVSGNDGKPITAEQWKAQGGSVKVQIGDNPSTVKVIVTGATGTDYAPYRIAATSGTSDYYNSLHIVGSGIFWEKNQFSMHTGAPQATDSDDSVQEIDDPAINTLPLAVQTAQRVSSQMCGGMQTVSAESQYLNRPNQWDNSDGSLDMYDQSFGNVVGSRMTGSEVNYRITSTTTTAENISYDMEVFTTVEDWNNFAEHVASISTIADFNAWYNGYRFVDFNNDCLNERSE